MQARPSPYSLIENSVRQCEFLRPTLLQIPLTVDTLVIR
jgi:hypothetical protein